MSSAVWNVLLCTFAVTIMFSPQSTGGSGMPYVLSKVKAENYDEVPAKITVKVGENVNIPCLMEHRLTNFAWMLCHSNCQSSEAKWKTVTLTDNYGSTTLSDPEKYGLGSDGYLLVKNIQLWDNENWFRCFYKERFVGVYYRTSIILIEQGRQLSHFLWPVTLRTTQIPCPQFRKALLFQKAFEYVAWYKVVVRSRACHSRWRTLWIAGMNSSWTVQTNGDSKYGLDQGGFLQIRNVTRDDDGTFYRCVVRAKPSFGIESTLILLAVVPEEGCESGIPFLITDKSITASSKKELCPADRYHGVFGEGRFWCSQEEKTSYIEIRFSMKYKIIGARIQLQRIYKIKGIILKIPVFNQWINIHYVKPPYTYSTSVNRIEPAKPFVAQSLRIRVLRKHSVESICLRVEVLGCNVPKGCILQGSAILIKKDGEYRKGFVGGIFYGWLEVFQFGETKSTLKKAADVILDEKPNMHELTNGTLVLGEDVNSPGIIREGNIEQVGASFCTIKTNNETWKSNLNDVRIVKISSLC